MSNRPSGGRAQRRQAFVAPALALLLVALLCAARRALLPLIIGTLLAYAILPLVNWLDSRRPPRIQKPRLWRGFVVLGTYMLAAALLLGLLAFAIPVAASQLNLLLQRLPDLGGQAYRAVPDIVQAWLNRYNQVVPTGVRSTFERTITNAVPSLLSALQAGALGTLDAVLSTLSFLLGLFVLPVWMFYIMRDQPEITSSLYRLVPSAYREDVHNVETLVSTILTSYLRGQAILCLSVGLMSTIGLLVLGIDFAVLLGSVAGVFEIVPVVGPLIGAIPAILVTLATAPSQVLKVVVLAVAVQQIENALLVPQVMGETVRLHPALVMLVLVIGSEIAGVWGVILSLPLTALASYVARYTYLRLADEPLSPKEAMAQVGVASRGRISRKNRSPAEGGK